MAEHGFCMWCMKEIGDIPVCPHCGFPASSVQKEPYLPYGTIVGGRYAVGRILDRNGEGVLYLGCDTENKTKVNIREFLPESIVVRSGQTGTVTVMPGCEVMFYDCCQSFLEMWRKLARMRGLSALLCVLDIIEDNGTAYAVYEAVDELPTLREFLLDTATGYISWEQARAMFMPVLSTLGTLHTVGIIHRGISPSTLLVTADGKLIISGFSIGQARSTNGGIAVQLFAGYAPIEQYSEGRQGPWTDVYAFAATLYRALVGSTPVEATSRVANDKLMIPAKFAEQLPAYVVNGLVNALQIMPDDRTRNVEQLRNDFSASPVAASGAGYSTYTSKPQPRVQAEVEREIIDPSKPEPKTKTAEEKRQNKRSFMAVFIVSVCICLAIIGTIVICLLTDRDINKPPEQSTTATGESAAPLMKVTNFVGMYSTDVTADAYYTKYYEFDVVFVFDADTEPGTIMQQSVAPQTEFSSSQKLPVQLTVSRGTEYVTITLADFVGRKYEAVKDQLKTIGVVCKVVEMPNVHQREQDAGIIVTIIPVGDDATVTGTELKVPVGSEVTVHIYASTTTAPATDASGAVITTAATTATTATTASPA